MKEFFVKVKNWFINHAPSKRRLIQVYAALLYNANLKGFIKGEIFTGGSKAVCVPGLNCYSCPGAIGACPLGSLQTALSKANNSFPYYVFGILLLYGIIFARTVCGWLCPVGLCQDLVYKIPSPKLKKSKYTRIASYLKYVLLIIFVIILPIVYSYANIAVPAFCKYICPAGIFEGAFGLLPANADFWQMLGSVFTWKFALFVAIAIMCVFCYRFFCRFMCPLGAIYSLFNYFSLIGVVVDDDKCTNCGKCIKVCKMDIKKVGDHECIQCGECLSVCPTHAIRWKGTKPYIDPNEGCYSKINKNKENVRGIEVNLDNKNSTNPELNSNNTAELKPNKNKKKTKEKVVTIILCSVMALTLAGAITYSFLGDGQSTPSTSLPTDPNPDNPGIAEKGQECFNFSLPIVGNDEMLQINELKGKVTYLNFWYTTCSGCVAELPYFQKFYENYQEDVNIVAIDPVDTEDMVMDWLLDFEYTFQFVMGDEAQQIEEYFQIKNAYPLTAILDRNGIIKEIRRGGMTEEMLISYYEQFK